MTSFQLIFETIWMFTVNHSYNIFVFGLFPILLSLVVSAVTAIRLLFTYRRHSIELKVKYVNLESKALQVLKITNAAIIGSEKIRASGNNMNSGEITFSTIGKDVNNGYNHESNMKGVEGRYVPCQEYIDSKVEEDNVPLKHYIPDNIIKESKGEANIENIKKSIKLKENQDNMQTHIQNINDVCFRSNDSIDNNETCRKRMLEYSGQIKDEIIHKVKVGEKKQTRISLNITPPKSYSKCIKKKWIDKTWMLPLANNDQLVVKKEDVYNSDKQRLTENIEMENKKKPLCCQNSRWIDSIDELGKVIKKTIPCNQEEKVEPGEIITNRGSAIGYRRLIESMKQRYLYIRYSIIFNCIFFLIYLNYNVIV